MKNRIAALLILGALSSAPAAAQVSKVNTVNLLTTFMRGVDVAHDATGGALVVSGVNYLFAQCVNPDGTLTGTYTVKPIGVNNVPYASFPRARFNPSAQNYLIVWPEEQSGGAMLLKARTMSCATGSMGAEHVIGSTPWNESGAAVDWSPLSSKYLVAWKSAVSPSFVYAQLVNADGTPSGGPVQLSTGFGRDPGVAWNPTTNEFGVSYSGETGDGAYSVLAIVPAANPGAVRRTTFNPIGNGSKTYLTDLAYNTRTQRWVMSWFQLSGGPFAKVAEFDNAGAFVSSSTASSSIGSYDALSFAWNRASGTFLLVGIDQADQLRVAELNGNGARLATEQPVATGFAPIRYPRVDANFQSARWFSVFSRGNGSAAFQGTGEVVFQAGSTGGPGPIEPVPPTDPGCPSVRPAQDWVCVPPNWLPPDLAPRTPNPSPPPPPPPPPPPQCPSVQPGPGWVCVPPNWLPADQAPVQPKPKPEPQPPDESSCTSIKPGPDWVCDGHGNWLPPGLAPRVPQDPPNDGTCSGSAPVAGWVCKQGNWLPPDHPLVRGG